MDPDQVGAASDLADTYAGGGGCAGSDECWARALLRRGWHLSLKAAIAGVAATAAPVVGPPIIILSIAGVALSVPFAAYLASLAATDRLMGALLPPTPPQPHYTDDLGPEEAEQEFVDASEAPDDEAPVFGHWRKTEEDAIMEQNGSFASLPPSLEPPQPQELVPLLVSEDCEIAGGEFATQKSDHLELYAPEDGKQEENGRAMEVDNEYITMEAPSPGDFSGSAAPSLLPEVNNMVQGMEDAPIPAKESVQGLSVSDNRKKTEDNASRITEETEFLSPGIGASESSVLSSPMLGNEDIMVQREGEAQVSLSKSGQDSHVSDSRDKTREAMTPCELNVSKSSVLDNNIVRSKIEEETALEDVMSDANPATGEVVCVQPDVIATTVPESNSLQSSDQVSCKIQAMTKCADAYDTLESALTLGAVKDVGDTGTGDVEHHGEGGVCTVVSVRSAVAEDDGKDLVSSRAPYVSAISNDTTSVESRLHSGDLHQTADSGNKELGKEEAAKDKCGRTEESKNMDGKVPSTDMETQDYHAPKSPVQDDREKGDNEVRVEMMLEEVTSSIGPMTGEAIEVQMDITASEIESLPLSDLVAHDLQAVTEAGMVDGKTEEAVKGIGATNINSVKRLNEGGACSSVSVTSVVTMDDTKDLMSQPYAPNIMTNRSTPYASAIHDDMTSIEGRPNVDHHHGTTYVGYKVMNEGFGMKEVAEDKVHPRRDRIYSCLFVIKGVKPEMSLPACELIKIAYRDCSFHNKGDKDIDIYTEEQLREELDTLRKITGYRTMPSLKLEDDLAGLYIFVGVEHPHSSGDASNLTKLNMKLRFLKSIIGVE